MSEIDWDEVDAALWTERALGVRKALLRAFTPHLEVTFGTPVSRAETLPLVDGNEAQWLLTRRRDLVDECVALTLREPRWLQ